MSRRVRSGTCARAAARLLCLRSNGDCCTTHSSPDGCCVLPASLFCFTSRGPGLAVARPGWHLGGLRAQHCGRGTLLVVAAHPLSLALLHRKRNGHVTYAAYAAGRGSGDHTCLLALGHVSSVRHLRRRRAVVVRGGDRASVRCCRRHASCCSRQPCFMLGHCKGSLGCWQLPLLRGVRGDDDDRAHVGYGRAAPPLTASAECTYAPVYQGYIQSCIASSHLNQVLTT